MKPKNILYTLLSITFVLALLAAGCAPAAPATTAAPPTNPPTQTQPTAEVVTFKFVGWGTTDEQAVFQSLVDTFNQQNPDIIIQYEPIPDSDYVTKLTTMVAGGTPPDIAYMPDGNFSAFVTKDQLVNIQQYVDKSDAIVPANIWSSALARYRYDRQKIQFGVGDLYALPKDIGPTNLYINKDMFKEAGVDLPDPSVPMTWDQVLKVAQNITVDANGKHPNEDGFDVNRVTKWGIGDLGAENVIFGNGGYLVTPDGRKFQADMKETVDAVQFISDLTHKYHVAPSSQQTSSESVGQMFENGKVAITFCGRWCTTGYRNTLKFDWDVIPPVVGPSGKLNAAASDCKFAGWSGSVGIAIMAGSNGAKYAEKAYRFVEFIAGPKGQTQQASLGFAIPNQVDLANSDVFLQPELNPKNAKIILETTRCEKQGPWTTTPLWDKWYSDLFWQGVWPDAVLDAKTTAEEALKSRAAQFQSQLDEAWTSIGK